MNPLVVLFAVVLGAQSSLVPTLLAQPEHLPALVLDPHGRPLDTAAVVHARALHLQAKALEGHHGVLAPVSLAAPIWTDHSALASPWVGAHGHLLKKRSLGYAALVHSAPVVHAIAPTAVSHQSRVDVVSSPAVVSHAVAAPVVLPHSVLAAPAHSVWGVPALSSHSVWGAPALNTHSVWGGLGLSGHGHLLKKRSLAHASLVHSAPLVHAIAPAAVSHQSRVDVISSPNVHAVVAHAAPAVIAYAAPSAISHQARLDVHSSPAALSHSVLTAPALSAHSVWGGLSAHGISAHGLSAHGLSPYAHLLKKRSLGYLTHAIAPSAVSHQSRVDVISSPALVSHAVAAPALYSAHAAVSPLVSSVHGLSAHYSHHGLHASPLLHAW